MRIRGQVVEAAAAAGLIALALWLSQWFSLGTTGQVLIGVTTAMFVVAAGKGTVRLPVLLLAPAAAVAVMGGPLMLVIDTLVLVGYAAPIAVVLALQVRRRPLAGLLALGSAGAGLAVSTMVAGAWTVGEPTSGTALDDGNGIIVSMDTHAFLIQQANVILRNDGRTAISDFLDSPDPTAPYLKVGDTRRRESYLWRMQTAARDADRSLKSKYMPDHFFNWWTHHGKGLIAGPSAATWAEQQYAEAVRAWRAGDRSTAMYHLGAATHLVDDGCVPPHESQFVPNHRRYENWLMARQDQVAVTSGGRYAADFRVHGGHGGDDWSSAHTRGWVDECAHHAAAYVINTIQPAADGPGEPNPPAGADGNFRFAQRMTAGYIAFFFDSVEGP